MVNNDKVQATKNFAEHTTRKESCRDVVHGTILFSSLHPWSGSALRRLLRRNTNRVKFKALHITRSNNNNPQVPTHPRLPFSFPPHVKPRAAATVPPDPIAVVVSSKLSPPVVFRSAISAEAARPRRRHTILRIRQAAGTYLLLIW